jgi:hypothetical protein
MTRLRAVLLSALSLISLPASALNLIDGHTGIYGVRSADTLAQGDYSYGFWADATSYQGAGNVQLPVQDMSMSFHQGVTDSFEVGMYFPARYAVGTQNLEFQQFGFALKFRTDNTPATHDAVAITLYGGILSADASKGVGSGQDNYGLSFDYTTTPASNYRFHSNLGMESSDAITVTSATSGTYAVESKLFWRVGLEMPFSDTSSWNLALALSNNINNASSKTSAMLLPSYTYTSPDKELRYHIGLGYNLNAENDLPIASVFLGVNYTFASPNKHIAALEHRIDELQVQMNNLTTSQARQDVDLALVDKRYNYLYKNDLPIVSNRVDAAEKRLDSLEQKQKRLAQEQKKLAAMKARAVSKAPAPKAAAKPHAKAPMPVMIPAKGKLRVEIINRSGDPKLEKRIAARLEKKGYVIVRSKMAKNSLKHSHVYYRNGYAKQAVTLGHALPKNQFVNKAADLPGDVDLRLVVGDDLK